jgi:hypothetical protein
MDSTGRTASGGGSWEQAASNSPAARTTIGASWLHASGLGSVRRLGDLDLHAGVQQLSAGHHHGFAALETVTMTLPVR